MNRSAIQNGSVVTGTRHQKPAISAKAEMGMEIAALHFVFLIPDP
jgi:hypothetical protein